MRIFSTRMYPATFTSPCAAAAKLHPCDHAERSPAKDKHQKEDPDPAHVGEETPAKAQLDAQASCEDGGPESQDREEDAQSRAHQGCGDSSPSQAGQPFQIPPVVVWGRSTQFAIETGKPLPESSATSLGDIGSSMPGYKQIAAGTSPKRHTLEWSIRHSGHAGSMYQADVRYGPEKPGNLGNVNLIQDRNTRGVLELPRWNSPELLRLRPIRTARGNARR